MLVGVAVLWCFLISVLVTQISRPSNATNTTFEKCGTMKYMREMWQKHPEKYQQHLEMREKIAQAISKGQNFTPQQTYTIPVVVHILYSQQDSAQEYVTDQEVFDLINDMNRDFLKQNADTAIVPAVWKPLIAKMDIQFCLAQQDPNGSPTNGIERRKTTITDFSFNTNAIKSTAAGGLDPWDPYSYFNIWVCDIGNFALGYAEFPPISNTYGIVLDYRTVRKLYPQYNKNRTATHEVGHCLGLYHIWGDDWGACSGSDLPASCDDTPNQANATYGCPAFPKTDACSPNPPGIMFYNYMDYSDDACLVMFTPCQKQVAMQTIQQYLQTLVNSNKCSPVTSPPVANFSYSGTGRGNVISCVSCPVKFNNLSTGGTSYYWNFGDGTTSNQVSPTHIYQNSGTYYVTLVVSNQYGSDTIVKPVIIVDGASCCDTLNYPFPGNPTIYLSSNGGYVAGNNGYGDLAKAEYFAEWQCMPNINGVIIKFGVAKNTSGGSVPVKIWSESQGKPGNTLFSTSVPLSQIVSDVSNGKSTIINFTNSVTVSSPYFIGVELPQTPGDTVAIVTCANGQVPNNTAWEQWDDGTWYPYNDPQSWGLVVSHYIAPFACMWALSTGNTPEIAHQPIVYQNPANKKEVVIQWIDNNVPERLYVSIFNAMGQVMLTRVWNVSAEKSISIKTGEFPSGRYLILVNDTEYGNSWQLPLTIINQ